jgi:hypothetical protein
VEQLCEQRALCLPQQEQSRQPLAHAPECRDFTQRLEGNLRDYEAADISFAELDASVQGWINHVRYGFTCGLREHVFSTHPIPKVSNKKRR